jgi:hypothetical protein
MSEVCVDTNQCVVVIGTVVTSRETSVVVIVWGMTVVSGRSCVDVLV